MRIALGLEYDGAPFAGWQSQPSGKHGPGRPGARAGGASPASPCASPPRGAPTPACTRSRRSCTSTPTPSVRTARGCAAPTPRCRLRSPCSGPRAVERRVPCALLAPRRAPTVYLLSTIRCGPRSSPARVGWFHRPLDVGAMREAAQCLVGEHDFSAFRSSECQAKSPVRTHASRSTSSAAATLRRLQAHARTRSCTTWCATSSAASSTSARAGTRRVDARSAARRATARAPRRPSRPAGLYLVGDRV